MKKPVLASVLALSLVSELAMGTMVPNPSVSADCFKDDLTIRFPVQYAGFDMTYLKVVTFVYASNRLIVETKSGPDRCHVPGKCASYATVPFNRGAWGLEVDGRILGSVEFDLDYTASKQGTKRCRYFDR